MRKQLEDSQRQQGQLSDKKQKAESHIRDIKTENEQKNKEKSDLELELESLKKDFEFEKNNRIIRENIEKWENSKTSYLEEQRNSEIKNFKINSKYCNRPIITLFITIVILPFYIKFFDKIKNYFASLKYEGLEYDDNIIPSTILIFLVLIAFYELIGRTYLTDKEKVKNGLKWKLAFKKSTKEGLLLEKLKQIESEYVLNNPKPKL
ncbi:hypothetical protein EG240_11830 [Paenimyroides tangerinum]|uniref:Uncharacterized protein n=1 Tax=Paenimyroides tangerinum TaxID=2488728 RepID=A0A3P3W2I9_9FLAO|nr:hypothetical protein [Paenimyroides tangerinum]RRJ89321.1 hypothetical protein EG240_11830 [Paenimyroides tangerinum]